MTSRAKHSTAEIEVGGRIDPMSRFPDPSVARTSHFQIVSDWLRGVWGEGVGGSKHGGPLVAAYARTSCIFHANDCGGRDSLQEREQRRKCSLHFIPPPLPLFFFSLLHFFLHIFWKTVWSSRGKTMTKCLAMRYLDSRRIHGNQSFKKNRILE